VAVPIAIFVVCITAGVFASSRWLPELHAGPVGGWAFFVVCGLLGAALALAGLHIYSIVEVAKHAVSSADFGRDFKAEIVASGVANMLWEVGSLLALATLVYLLAPRSDGPEEPAVVPAPGPPLPRG
jgi:hypothetical protein